MYDTIIIGNHLQFDHVKESLVYWFVLLMKRTSHPNASELDAKHWLALGYNQILFIGFARAGWYRLIPKYSKHSKYSKKKWKKRGIMFEAFHAGTRQGHPWICGDTSRPQQERTSEVAWCGLSCMDGRTAGRPNPVRVRSDPATGFLLDTVCCFCSHTFKLCHFHWKKYVHSDSFVLPLKIPNPTTTSNPKPRITQGPERRCEDPSQAGLATWGPLLFDDVIS